MNCGYCGLRFSEEYTMLPRPVLEEGDEGYCMNADSAESKSVVAMPSV